MINTLSCHFQYHVTRSINFATFSYRIIINFVCFFCFFFTDKPWRLMLIARYRWYRYPRYRIQLKPRVWRLYLSSRFYLFSFILYIFIDRCNIYYLYDYILRLEDTQKNYHFSLLCYRMLSIIFAEHQLQHLVVPYICHRSSKIGAGLRKCVKWNSVVFVKRKEKKILEISKPIVWNQLSQKRHWLIEETCFRNFKWRQTRCFSDYGRSLLSMFT